MTAIKTKGGVAVRLSLFGSTFLFITSHFSGRALLIIIIMNNGLLLLSLAGFGNVIDRNADMHKIANNLSFPGMKTSSKRHILIISLFMHLKDC